MKYRLKPDQVAKSATRFTKDAAGQDRSIRKVHSAVDFPRAEALGDDIERVAGTPLDTGGVAGAGRMIVPDLTFVMAVQLNERL
jgi:hypothetical protein